MESIYENPHERGGDSNGIDSILKRCEVFNMFLKSYPNIKNDLWYPKLEPKSEVVRGMQKAPACLGFCQWVPPSLGSPLSRPPKKACCPRPAKSIPPVEKLASLMKLVSELLHEVFFYYKFKFVVVL